MRKCQPIELNGKCRLRPLCDWVGLVALWEVGSWKMRRSRLGSAIQAVCATQQSKLTSKQITVTAEPQCLLLAYPNFKSLSNISWQLQQPFPRYDLKVSPGSPFTYTFCLSLGICEGSGSLDARGNNSLSNHVPFSGFPSSFGMFHFILIASGSSWLLVWGSYKLCSLCKSAQSSFVSNSGWNWENRSRVVQMEETGQVRCWKSLSHRLPKVGKALYSCPMMRPKAQPWRPLCRLL